MTVKAEVSEVRNSMTTLRSELKPYLTSKEDSLRRNSLCLIVVLMAALMTGCATFGGKFTSSTQADIGYFTDATVTMMKDANFGFTRGNAIYTREFIAKGEPEESALFKAADDSDKVLKGIVRYSLQLVTISESGRSESERIQQYADYLAQIQGGIQKALELPPGHYEGVLRDVRKQKHLLEALRTAQPLITGMGRFMDQTLNQVDAATGVVARKLEKKIDTRYAEVIAYQGALDREKYDVLRALSYIYRTGRKDDSAYKDLMKSQQIRDPKLIPQGKPTYDQLMAMVKYLMGKFDIMHKIQKEIEPDWQTYRETHRELQRLESQIHQEVKQFRLISITWVRAHQKMSAGKTKPAEWFDFNEAAMKGLKSSIDLIL